MEAHLPEPRLLAVVGPDGVGKSTLIEALARHLEAKGARARPVEIWDLLSDPELNVGRFMGTKAQFREYLLRLSGRARSLFLFHALTESLERARSQEADWILVAGYWPKYRASEEARGLDPTWLEGLSQAFPEPNLWVRLKLPLEELSQRRDQVTAYEAEGRDFAHFLKLQARQEELLDAYLEGRRVEVVDARASVEEVRDSVLRILEAEERS